MSFQFWDFSTPSNMFNSVPKTTFPANVSSYFRRPSKVVKPSSRNNSPRTSSRRRMTTSGQFPTRTRSVVDHQRASMPQLSDSYHMNSRPISWHPNMMDDMNQFQLPSQATSEGLMMTPYTTAEINGLVTPMSYPLVNEPQIQELITPLEGLSANESGSGYDYGQDFEMTQYWLAQQTKDPVIDFDPSTYSMMNYQPWYSTNHYMMPNVPTAPTSPSFMPMSDYAAQMPAPVVVTPGPETEELVAMGLYDSPADVQSSSLLFGGAPVRKSLKLEDSFEPSPNGDDEDDEDAVAAEDDDEYDQPTTSPTNIEPTHDNMTNDITTADYPHVMDNGYITNQWQMPNQSHYGWI